MKMFIDTHDKTKGSFPEQISRVDFAAFYEAYLAACRAEGVISMRIHVGIDEGRAFCVNLASSVDAVRRVHDRVGVPFDSITEVQDVNAFDLFVRSAAA